MKNIFSSVEVLSQSEIEMIHENALRVLREVGIKVPNAEILDVCQGAGAVVDKASEVVKIPSHLISNILQRIKNYHTEKANTLARLDGNICTEVFVVDYKTKTRRYGTSNDILKGLALTEHLQSFSKANAVVVPNDVPSSIADVEAHRMIFTYSSKPGNTFVLSPGSAKYILEMSKIMGLKQYYLLETISPLQFRKESLEMVMVYVKAGQGLVLGPMVMGGATGPVTLAGTMVLETAEILGSIFLMNILNDEFGTYGAPVHTIDLSTSLCTFGAPNQALLGIATAQMGKFYGLQATGNVGLTDAIMPDFQAGFEKGITAVIGQLAGTSGIGSMGISGADQGFSFEQLVLDNEWIDYYNYITRGFEVNEETIGFDAIKNVGIGGNFIAEEHTVVHMDKNNWLSGIFSREAWETWLQKGAKDSLDIAHEFVEDVTSGYMNRMPVINAGDLDLINRISEEAKEELVNFKK